MKKQKRILTQVPEYGMAIVQVMGGDKKNQKAIEDCVLAFCIRHDIDVIVRSVQEAHLRQNFRNMDSILFELCDKSPRKKRAKPQRKKM